MLTGGNVADLKAGGLVMPARGDDSDTPPDQRPGGALANIPRKANRIWKNCCRPFLYRDRNALERIFCRINDLIRIATRYDGNAARSAADQIAAALAFCMGPDPLFTKPLEMR